MVKDLHYFLDQEDKFCKKHPDYGNSFYDKSIGEMSEKGIDDCLNFLSDKVFSKTQSTIKEPLGKELEYGLSDAQRVLLRMFYCDKSRLFRDDYYEEITEVVQNMFDTLDDVVKKAPINSDSLLYRFCNDYDRSDMKVSDVISFPHNLTCTNYDWGQAKYNHAYYITPLKGGKSRAHNLFEIYKHGDEKQVVFLRNTKFKVTKIENTEGTEYKKFYLEEVEE